MSIIRTNSIAVIANKNLASQSSNVSKAMERLSSGRRINQSSDDSAGQVIANRMTSQINGLSVAKKNANNGISIAQTAESALSDINSNLQRMRTLAVQFENDTNSLKDRLSIQREIHDLSDEIFRISEESSFNGVPLFDRDKTIPIQVGANDGQTVDIELNSLKETQLKLDALKFVAPEGELKPIANDDEIQQRLFGENRIVGVDIAVTDKDDLESRFEDGDGNRPEFRDQRFDALVDENDNLFLSFFVASPNQEVSDNLAEAGLEVPAGFSSFFFLPLQKEDFEFVTNSNGDDTLTMEISAFDIDPRFISNQKTRSPIEEIDASIAKIDSLRSSLGAVQNTLASAADSAALSENNLTAARSRIVDADYAVEVGRLTSAQILQQAGTSILAQANQVPNTVLSLLQ